jgi:hypothetical protein
MRKSPNADLELDPPTDRVLRLVVRGAHVED